MRDAGAIAPASLILASGLFAFIIFLFYRPSLAKDLVSLGCLVLF